MLLAIITSFPGGVYKHRQLDANTEEIRRSQQQYILLIKTTPCSHKSIFYNFEVSTVFFSCLYFIYASTF